jgi:hypothetical protein
MTVENQVADSPIEIETSHRCLLGDLTDALCDEAAQGVTGKQLARRASDALAALLESGMFQECCLPAYLSLAPPEFEREIQLPVACSDTARLDTRVLLWPVGAKDGQHPHCDGWATFVAVQGNLTTEEERGTKRLPQRTIAVGEPNMFVPEQDVSHHIHNVGHDVGLTIHVFGI